MKRDPYPLQWPEDWPRARYRQRSRFAARSFGLIRDELLDELRKLNSTHVVITSNIATRLDGLPYANAREPDDPGIAVYFQRGRKPYVIACDRYPKAWENLRAIAATVAAIRTIDRHGASELLERAVSGFAALPPGLDWRSILKLSGRPSAEQIKAAVRRLTLEHHPDLGGAAADFRRIREAGEAALHEIGGAA